MVCRAGLREEDVPTAGPLQLGIAESTIKPLSVVR